MPVEETRAGVEKTDASGVVVTVKALGVEQGGSNVQSPGESNANSVFSGTGGMRPPFDPDELNSNFEDSALLRPNVDAYVQNVDGTGHRFEPYLNPDSDGADEEIKAALRVEKMRGQHWRLAQAGADLGLFEPTDLEIYTRKERLRRVMAFEKARLDAFFAFACRTTSFTILRMQTRHDLEVTGNAYWEVLRDKLGDIAEFVQVPSYTVRLLKLDADLTSYQIFVKVTAITVEERPATRRFRRYVQMNDGRPTYFKEFSDPRVISRKTGKVWTDPDAWAKAKAKDKREGEATELLHFRIYSSTSPYGVPRWIGALTEVLGARAASEVNHSYFDNKAVPPLALLVSGGKLHEDSAKQLKDLFDNRVKGRKNFHGVLILEALSVRQQGDPSPVDSGKIRISLEPLMNAAQMKDALFMGYTTQAKQLVREQFRNPPIMVGDSRDYNRATAETARSFAEDQVYAAPRQAFDDVINRLVLPDMGVSTYQYLSNSIVAQAAEMIAKILVEWSEAGIITPEEARLFGHDVLGKELVRVDAPWAQQPFPLTLAQAKAVAAPTVPGKDAEGDAPLGIPDLPPAGNDPGGMAASRLKMLEELRGSLWSRVQQYRQTGR